MVLCIILETNGIYFFRLMEKKTNFDRHFEHLRFSLRLVKMTTVLVVETLVTVLLSDQHQISPCNINAL